MSFFAFYFKESPTYLSSAKEPNILVHDDKDSGDDNPNSPYSLMIGEHLYCQVTKSENTLGHCLIQLLALY